MKPRRDNYPSKIDGYGVKLVVALFGFVAAFFGAGILGRWFEAIESELSVTTAQLVDLIQLLPLLLFWMLFIRYLTQHLMHIPHDTRETLFRYEKSAVRGLFSVAIALFSFGWWVQQILFTELWAHALFTWPFAIHAIAASHSSWYFSKAQTYRNAYSRGDDFPEQYGSGLPSLYGLIKGFRGGQVRIEKIGFERGLPSLLFKVQAAGDADKVLNFGLDRLLPTAIVERTERLSETTQGSK